MKKTTKPEKRTPTAGNIIKFGESKFKRKFERTNKVPAPTIPKNKR